MATDATETRTLEVRPALGNFDGVAAVLGPNQKGAGACWCLSYRNNSVKNPDREAAMELHCSTAPGPGVLLYVDGEVAGWCSVAPRSTYRRLMNSRTIPFLDERDAWSIVCLVLRAPFRRQGLMLPLLEGAVAWAAENGAEVVEGYPVELDAGEKISNVGAYVGTVALFERAGFDRTAPTTAHSDHRLRWIMRRELGTE